MRLIIKIHQDHPYESPNDWGGWKVQSFLSRHQNVEPEDVGFEYDYDAGCHKPDKELQEALDSGMAFMLDYYEHGLCRWSLSGEGPQCRWDNSRFAGILTFEAEPGDLPCGPDGTPGQRRDYAKRYLEIYTSWCNGEVYAYSTSVEKECCTCGTYVDAEDDLDFDLPACTGFIGDDWIEGALADIRDQVPDFDSYEIVVKEEYPFGAKEEIEKLLQKEAV